MTNRIRVPIILLSFAAVLAAQAGPVEPALYHRLEKQPEARASQPAPPGLAAGLPAPVEVALPPLSDAEKPAGRASAAPVVGVHRKLPAGAVGAWETLSPGRPLWRIALRSPGASAFRLHFTDFAAGEGRVWMYENRAAGPEIYGPYTGRGIHGDGDFWSDVVFHESVIVEYEPAGAGDATEPPFRLAEIAHLWAGINPLEQQVGPCQLDVSCYPDWAQSARGVAHIVFEKEGSSFVCTGALLNTRNQTGTPYFLTAAHCIDNDAAARSVQAFWFYQTSTCNGPAVPRTSFPRSLGARYLAGRTMADGDSALLRLNDVPSGVMFLGWDPGEPPVGSPMTGIHHPRGSYKRISLGTRDADGSIGLPPQLFYKVRWNSGATDPGSSGSPVFSRPGVVAGQLSHGPRIPEGLTGCDVERTDYYGRFAVSYPLLSQYLEERAGSGSTTGGGTSPPPSGAPTVLSSGVAAGFSLPAVTGPTLMSAVYRIDAPQNATRLEVRLVTTTPGVDVDLHVRFGSEPALVEGRIVADYSSTGETGNETVVITPQSTPALRAGAYFIRLAVFTPGIAASGTITATVTTAAAPPPAGGTPIRSGEPASFSLPAVSQPTLFSPGFRIDVPPGARSLDIRLATQTPNVDVDLYVRYGEQAVVSAGSVVADYSSTGETGEERIVINAASNPPLRAGIYFIHLALYSTGAAAAGTVTATIDGGAAPVSRLPLLLTSGVPASFSLPAVNSPTLMTLGGAFRIVVPDGATRLEVKLVTNPATVDTDLYVRFGGEPDLAQGRVVADYASIGDTGVESITITPASSQPLRPGTYYITLALYSTGTAATGTVTAAVERAAAPAPSATVPLNSGSPASFNLPSVASPTLFTGSGAYRITVPQGATQLEVRVNTSTAGADVDLYVRFGSEPAVVEGRVVADYRSAGESGNESVVISSASSPPLQAGTYFIALVLYTTGRAAQGSVVATVQTGGGAPPQLSAVVHGASFARGAIAPGQIVSLFGQLLGPVQGVGGRLNAAGRVETRVDDTVVSFDGVSAPLFYVSAGQINAQVPYSVDGRDSTQVRVIRQGRISNTLTVPVAATAPGLFVYPDGQNRLIVVNQDGTLNSPANGAARGSVVVFFGTGEGQTSPAGEEGAPAAAPLPRPLRGLAVRIGGQPAEVLYAGAAPGFIGLLQINARVPAGSASGERTTVQVTIGNASTEASMAVRQ